MSDTKAEEDKLIRGNDIEPISSTIQTIQTVTDDNDPNKDNSIISSSISVVPERLEELRPEPATHTPLITRTIPFIPQEISTEPNRVINENTPPAFITPKRRIAFTVEDYLKSLTETQRMRLIEKTNQKIETLLELKRQAQEIIAFDNMCIFFMLIIKKNILLVMFTFRLFRKMVLEVIKPA